MIFSEREQCICPLWRKTSQLYALTSGFTHILGVGSVHKYLYVPILIDGIQYIVF